VSSVQLSEAAVYSDNDDLPGSQLVDATFDISTPLNTSATTFYTFNSTRPEGIQLYVGTSYWLVVNNPNIVYQSLSATSYQAATNATIIDLGQLAQYNQGFQEWTSLASQSFRVALQGCRGVLPPSPSPSPSPSNSPAPSASPSPISPSVTPSPAPVLSPVVSKVKASFAPQRPVVDMIAGEPFFWPHHCFVHLFLYVWRLADAQLYLRDSLRRHCAGCGWSAVFPARPASRRSASKPRW
jgi:hypothetical protein